MLFRTKSLGVSSAGCFGAFLSVLLRGTQSLPVGVHLEMRGFNSVIPA
jgi:hypothetical protein